LAVWNNTFHWKLYDVDSSFKIITVECKFVRISCLFKLHIVGYIKTQNILYILSSSSI
jgi:hypothetical protein